MRWDIIFSIFLNFQEYYTKLLYADICKLPDLESCIKKYYKDNCGSLYHISLLHDLSVIKPSSNFDMYGIHYSHKVFATSNPYEIWLYACRAVS